MGPWLWWLRGGPSSQSSPVGRRGKTSRPRPSDHGDDLGRVPSFSFPQRGGRFKALPFGEGRTSIPFGEGRTSITRGGCEAAPHLNLLPWGLPGEAKTPGPRPSDAPLISLGEKRERRACPLSVSPRGGKAGGEGDSRIAPTGEMDSRFRGNDGCGWVAQGSPLGEGKTPPPRPARLRRGLPDGVHRPQPLLLRGEEQRGGGAGEHRRFRGRRPEREAAGELQRVVGPQRVTL